MNTSNPSLDSLKIALVHETLTVPGGAESVLLELHKLFPDAPIYTPLYRPEKFPELKGARVVTSWFNRFSFWRNRHQLAIPFLPFAFEQFDLSEYDLVISDSAASAKGVLTRPETIHICYCHTPMRWAWLPHIDKRASSSFIRRLSAHYLRIWDIASLNRVDYWLANSRTTAERIQKFYRRDAKVIYPPVALAKKQVETKDDGYYLSIGRLVEQKRIDIIIEAVTDLDVPLKIVGNGPMLPELKKLAHGVKSIEFLGFVSEDEKEKLYSHCKAFIFASEEDFGIVPIEAMSYGKPVVAYARGGASETVNDGKTGLHFESQSAESLASAIKKFETQSFDSEHIIDHANQFSDSRFRNEIMEYIVQTVSNSKK